MKIEIEPGTYVVAVSGGVDSMVLLDMLGRGKNKEQRAASRPSLHFIVAHYDHGIREDSEQDREVVQAAAERYGLPFVFDEGHLGTQSSEALARQKRYAFLHRVQKAAGARAIITAHHQDDVLETAILNLLRGTGRRGLSSLKNTDELIRPLLDIPKKELVKYAKTHKLIWREDSTNSDEKFKRNWVRQQIMPKLKPTQRAELLGHIKHLRAQNAEIDKDLQGLSLYAGEGKLDRQAFIGLPHALSLEVMAAWLRIQDLAFDTKSLERLVRAAKTYKTGRRADIDAQHFLIFDKTDIILAVKG